MPNTTTFITHIRDLIAKDDVKTAIQALSALLKDSPRLDEAVQQSARYSRVMREIRLGVVDFQDADITKNQISFGVLELLREIEEQQQTQPSIKAEVERYYNKNTVTNSTITAGGNVMIGDTHINYSDRKLPRYLTAKPFQTDFFIGREHDLAAIETGYKEQNRLLVLVNGEGGMGKTTLAAQYWFKYESRYKHLAWMFADSGIGNALLSLANILEVQFNQQDDAQTQIARITAVITNLETPCLFVFDNANNEDDLEAYLGTLRRLSNCQILLTSRVTALEGVSAHRVKPLDKNFAVQVFIQHYPKHIKEENGLLDALFVAVAYNTLVIELLAKNLTVFNKFQTQYSLSSLVTDLQGRGLLAVQGKPVKTLYQASGLRSETPDAIIAAMYDVSALTDTERLLLNNFAVLPAENIPYNLFMLLLKPYTPNAYDDSLSTLHQKGWIDFYEATNEFKISPVIQHIIKRQNAMTLLDDCESLIDTLIDELDENKMHKDNYKMSTVFARYAELVVTAFETPHSNVAFLCGRISTYNRIVGKLDKALDLSEKMNYLLKKLDIANPTNENFKNDLANSYFFLGIVHTFLGNLFAALQHFQRYHHLQKELNAAYPNNVNYKNGLAISYSKLGETYAAMGSLDKALRHFQQYHDLVKELYVAYPTNVSFKNGLALSYSNLGETHMSLGDLDKALGFFEEDIKLSKEIYESHLKNLSFKNSLATSYKNLGVTHTSMGNLDAALRHFQQFHELEKELSEAYPTNVEFKNCLAISNANLGMFFRDNLNDKTKAREYFQQANDLWKELVRDAPQYVQFQQFLGQVQIEMKSLD